MLPLYAHRLNHGEDCGFSVELSIDDYTEEEDTTVHPVTVEMLDAFVSDYIKTNTHDGDLISDFVDTDKLKRFLVRCADIRYRAGRNANRYLNDQEKSYITDAEIFFDDYIESRGAEIMGAKEVTV